MESPHVKKCLHALDAFFRPKTVAVIGAKDTPNSVGRTILVNLTTGGFTGKVLPVNPNRKEVLGIPCIPSVTESPDPIDLAVIVVPAAHVLEVMQTCVQAHVKAVIVIAAGFKESGPEGLRLEIAVADAARGGGIRMMGPNCLGLMNPSCGLNASFGKGMPKTGSIAFISQSGALCAAVLDRSLSDGIGFSAFVSIGSMADVGWSDLIEYFGEDPSTKGILMYMETVGDPRGFLSAASAVAAEKPIIVIKPGRSSEAAKAAASHTGALVGSDKVFDAACERAGVLRVDTVSELFDIAEVLSFQPKPAGPRLAIITNAGGPAVLATDAVVAHGAEMAKLRPKTIEHLSTFLPPAWSHSNPVDVLGDADPQRYEKAVEDVSKDTEVDGMLVILTPQDMTDPTKTAESLRRFAVPSQKTFLSSWMGGNSVLEGRGILSKSGIPCFEYPDDAAWSFATMWKHVKTMNAYCAVAPRWRPCPSQEETKRRVAKAKEMIVKAAAEKRAFLSERESKQLLKSYGVPVVEAFLARSGDEAVEIAERIGFPVVLKVESPTITHKSDVGGVFLRLVSKVAVREAFSSIKNNVIDRYGKEAFFGVTVQKMVEAKGIELIVGSSIDPQFGPVILFGAGGIYVEAFRDEALGFPPLNALLARKMIERTKISRALANSRGGGKVPLEPIEDLLISLSELVLEVPEVAECDLNPILASPTGVLCLDARVVLGHPDFRVTPACRPYPTEYMKDVSLIGGGRATIRPIRAEDCSMVATLHEHLSVLSTYKKIFNDLLFHEKIVSEELIRLCWSNFDRRKVVVAEYQDIQREIVGVAVLQHQSLGGADLWFAVDPRFDQKGVPSALVAQVLDIAAKEGVAPIRAPVPLDDIQKKLGLEEHGFIEESRTDHYVIMIRQDSVLS
jgi:acetyltransferase